MKPLLSLLPIVLFLLASCSPGADATPAPIVEVPHEGTLRVAYSKQADPWIWIEGEGSRQLVDSVNVMEIVISSDGQWVAFKRDDTGEILAVKADGTGLRTVVNTSYLEAMDASVWVFDFVPQSHTLLFTLKQAGLSFTPFYDLYGSEVTAMTPVITLVLPAGQGGIPTFSADGQWMSVYHKGGLDIARPDGSEKRNIFTYPVDYEPATFGPAITWLSDSSGFYLYHVPDPLVSLSPGALWFVPVTGEAEQKFLVNSTWGIPSPDGQQVGYSTPGSPVEIRIAQADGSDSIYKSFASARFGGWAPDSQYFFIYVDEDNGGRVVTIPYLCRMGEEPVKLTDTEAADPVIWLTETEFLFSSWGDLRLQHLGQPSIEVDTEIYNLFDYTLLTP